ncbi:MAG: DUF4097 domain-containing protein [Clostridiales bacterium]|jgi:hypothetical protein|nr:DUF4097 domain-containing protein [Clostridiales bacterium]
MKKPEAKKMKKILRNNLIILGVLMFIGGGIAAAFSFAALGWDVFALDTRVYTAQTLTATDLGITDPAAPVKIDADIGNWTIRIQNGDAFRLDYYTTEGVEVVCGYDAASGKVSVTAKEDWVKFAFNLDWFNGIGRLRRAYVFTVPAGTDLTLENDNSPIEASDAVFGSLKIESGDGSVKLNNVKAGEVNIRGKNGGLKLDGCEFGSLDVQTGNGSVKTDGTSVAGGAVLRLHNGSLKLNGCEFGSLQFHGNNASLLAENVTSPGTFHFNADNGSVKLYSCAFSSVVGNVSDASVITENLDVGTFKINCSDGSLKIGIRADKADFKSIEARGSDAVFKFGGERYRSGYKYSGGGDKVFEAEARDTSVELKLS